LALTSAGQKAGTPCDAFLDAEQDGNARIIQATSLLQDNWKKWQKVYQARLYVMEYFSSDEMKSLGFVRLHFTSASFLLSSFQQNHT